MNDAASVAHERLTLAGLLIQIRRWPKVFVVTVLLTMAALITYALVAQPVYRCVVKVMPRENDAGGGALSSVLGQFGGLAAMAGLSLGSVDEQESIAWLRSRALFTLFLKEQNLMPILFRGQWDTAAQRWRADLKHVPTLDDAWAMFDGGIRRVNLDPKTRVITLDITWKDREQAAAWANGLVKLANDELRQRALRESAVSIASFEEQLSHTDAVELKQAIYKLMEAQVNRSAIAKSRADYALTVLDPAFVPDERRFVSPRRFLMYVISLPLGLFFAVCLVLAIEFTSRLIAQTRNARV